MTIATKTPSQVKLLVFREICRHDNDLMSSWVPLPATVIAKCLNISLYQCRKQMQRLVRDGLAVRSSCAPLYVEDCTLPYHGFLITEKGRDTDIYRYCALKSARICAECFGGSMEQFLPETFNYAWIGKEAPKRDQLFEI